MLHRLLLVLLLSTVAPRAAEGFSFRTLCPRPHEPGATLRCVATPESAPLEVELPSANFSLEHYQARSRTLRFFDGPITPEAEPVAVARVPASLRDAILLFLPGEKEATYRVTAFDGGLEGFRGGDQRFLNLAPVPVAVDLGGRRAVIDPGDTRTIRLPASSETGRHPLQLFQRPGENWERFSATRVTVDPRIRRLLLVYPDPVERRLRTRAIHDRVDGADAE